MAGDLSSDHAEPRVVAHDFGFQFPGGKEHPLALDGFIDDSPPLGDRSLRWQGWKVS